MRWVPLVLLAACHKAAPPAERAPEISKPAPAPLDAAPAPAPDAAIQAIAIDADDFPDFVCTRTTDSGFDDGEIGGGLTGEIGPVGPPNVRLSVASATGALDAENVGCHLALYLDTVADCAAGDVSITFWIKDDGSVSRISAGGGGKALQNCALKLLERMRGDFGFPISDGETEVKIALRFS